MRIGGMLLMPLLLSPLPETLSASEPLHIATKVVCPVSLETQRPLLVHLARGYASLLDPTPADPTCIASLTRDAGDVPAGSDAVLLVEFLPSAPAGSHPMVFRGKALLVTANKNHGFSINVRRGTFLVDSSSELADKYLLDGGLGSTAWRLGLLDQDRPRRRFFISADGAFWGELLVDPPRS